MLGGDEKLIAMRVQVDCRKVKAGGSEPRSFVLGTRRLWVLRVLERHANTLSRHFTVSIADGRRFELRQDIATGEWWLARVIPAALT
ncbi:MAG TPA: hypothetical protein VEV21_13105 [Burkholderiales bacterium]|nr:hypothetical protein [Burkholderiales bacterium]